MSNVNKGQAPVSLPFNKTNYFVVEQERNLLKITLGHVANENESLKQQVEDMRMTVKHNKDYQSILVVPVCIQYYYNYT